jgi:hypothetical protein
MAAPWVVDSDRRPGLVACAGAVRPVLAPCRHCGRRQQARASANFGGTNCGETLSEPGDDGFCRSCQDARLLLASLDFPRA